MEVVIQLLRAVVGRFAARRFQFLHQIPQQRQFVRIGIIKFARRQRRFVEQRLQRVVAQVGGDVDAFDAALMPQYRQCFRVHFVVHRQRRADAIRAQREGLHHAVRQHGDFLSGHVHRGQP